LAGRGDGVDATVTVTVTGTVTGTITGTGITGTGTVAAPA